MFYLWKAKRQRKVNRTRSELMMIYFVGCQLIAIHPNDRLMFYVVTRQAHLNPQIEFGLNMRLHTALIKLDSLTTSWITSWFTNAVSLIHWCRPTARESVPYDRTPNYYYPPSLVLYSTFLRMGYFLNYHKMSSFSCDGNILSTSAP